MPVPLTYPARSPTPPLRLPLQDGVTAVGDPTPTRHTSAAALAIAAAATTYFREKSVYPVWDKRSHTGYWRLVIGEARGSLGGPGRHAGTGAAPANVGPKCFCVIPTF